MILLRIHWLSAASLREESLVDGGHADSLKSLTLSELVHSGLAIAPSSELLARGVFVSVRDPQGLMLLSDVQKQKIVRRKIGRVRQ